MIIADIAYGLLCAACGFSAGFVAGTWWVADRVHVHVPEKLDMPPLQEQEPPSITKEEVTARSPYAPKPKLPPKLPPPFSASFPQERIQRWRTGSNNAPRLELPKPRLNDQRAVDRLPAINWNEVDKQGRS